MLLCGTNRNVKTKMKVAHLILTHKQPRQLERLIQALDYPGADFFIHVDRKADITPFQYLFAKPNVFMVQKRTPIYWAAYGTIQAILNGFAEILPKQYNYINVMSGQDFPLKPAGEFFRFLEENNGQEFITARPLKEEWPDALSRVYNYHLVNVHWMKKGKHRLEQLMNAVLPRRRFPLNYTLAGGPNWFTVTSEAAAFIIDVLELRPDIARYFKYCWGADEFIFASILYNSAFRERLRECLLFCKWLPGNGHAEILTTNDLEEMKASGKFFARKFDTDTDNHIFSVLEELIGSKRQIA
ncbi:beta-1,6-N-acetylglucosaminyltransferase [Deminuibacter soli]|uniref:Peptide O-xylosyltransferase n=1 Tax=Deminuibacter soli TaxID=2291815 RepID=A0A3E1NQH6_9BACT|nr:beta-1,6-N-acetylglucosaminyltransferase [Deminuibacter soli]RFM30175.1 glycosyl transferase [Deminuibacter soli]